MHKNYYKYILIALSIIVIILLVIVIYKLVSYKDNSSLNDNSEIDSSKYIVKIYLNGADKVDKDLLVCEENDNCELMLPKAYRVNGEVLGFSKDPSLEVAEYSQNAKFQVTGNVDLYVISKKTNTLHIDNSDIDYLEQNDLTCTTYNSNPCIIKIPSYNKNGSITYGYAKEKNAFIPITYPNEEFELTDSITLYPVYDINKYDPIDVQETIDFNNHFFVEVGKECINKQNTISGIQIYNKINTATPYFFNFMGNNHQSKVRFYKTVDNKYTLFDTDDASGVVHGSEFLPLLDMPDCGACDTLTPTGEKSLIYPDGCLKTHIHELSHMWDVYYMRNISKEHKYLSESQELTEWFELFRDVYNNYPGGYNSLYFDGDIKYVKVNGENVSAVFFRYALTNKQEFFAELSSYYYAKYVNPGFINYYRNGGGSNNSFLSIKTISFPEKLKKLFDKYYCELKNNYDGTDCD